MGRQLQGGNAICSRGWLAARPLVLQPQEVTELLNVWSAGFGHCPLRGPQEGVELRKEGAKTKSAAGSEVESAQIWGLGAASRIGGFRVAPGGAPTPGLGAVV
jgi:hypothetical protein